MKGTLRFSENLGDDLDSEPISIQENHYSQDQNKGENSTYTTNARLFYMSSEENSEPADSPPDLTNRHQSKPPNSVVELCDYKASEQTGRKHSKSLTSNGNKDYEDSRYRSASSPNPLYRYEDD